MKQPAALLLVVALAAPALAQDAAPTLPDAAQDASTAPDAAEAAPTPQAELDALFASLAAADPTDARRLEQRIMKLWSRSGSESMDYLLSRGQEALEAEEHAKAVDHLSALIALAPDFAEGWNARATAHFAAKDYWASMADIQRALALEPRHFGALAGLGMILEQTGDEAGALRAHREALRLNPHMEGAAEAVKRLEVSVDGRDI